jgi:hypothetical protein
MNAYSLINHRMFVAALSHDEAPAATTDASAGVVPARTAAKENSHSILRPRPVGGPLAGVLLANAMLHGYQTAAS